MRNENNRKLLSIIVPCCNEAKVLDDFHEALELQLAALTASGPEALRRAAAACAPEGARQPAGLGSNYDYEIIYINDGSTDASLNIIKGLAAEDSRVRYISLSRNFGKESAMLAGLEYAEGDCAVIMDADLQDPPALLPEMYHAVTKEGYDTVATRRVTRKGEPPIRSFFARMFYKLINKMSDVDIVDGARDFQMMSRKVVDAILSMKEYNRFSKGIFGWVGFKKKWLEYENIERVAGETKWNFWKLFLYAIEGIVAFSTVPLVLSSILGLLCCILAFIMIIFVIIRTLVFGDPTAGWPSLVCIILLLSGIQMLGIGIVGQYLAKTYLEAKNRPIYLISKTNLE